jgi:hypothetical protein
MRSLSLPLVVLLACALCASLATATEQTQLLTELELALPVYARFEPELWNGLDATLARDFMNDLDRLARLVNALHATLSAGLPRCRAVERAVLFTYARVGRRTHEPTARSVGEACRARWFADAGAASESLDVSSPLLAALRMAHNVGLAVAPRDAVAELARIANLRMAASNDEAVAYSSQPGAYASPLAGRVVAAVTRDEQRRRRRRRAV